jgi:hypothetical protein
MADASLKPGAHHLSAVTYTVRYVLWMARRKAPQRVGGTHSDTSDSSFQWQPGAQWLEPRLHSCYSGAVQRQTMYLDELITTVDTVDDLDDRRTLFFFFF